MTKPKLYYRQKVLLSILQLFNKPIPAIDFQKYLFLFTQEYQASPCYDFIPYKYGCFSYQSYADRRKLTEFGILAENQKWLFDDREEDYISTLTDKDQDKLSLFKKEYEDLSGDPLVRYVYTQYPYYAIHSEIAGNLLNSSELAFVDAERPSQNNYKFFTIGYEGNSLEHYLNRLIKNNVRLLCDVRKNPYSRKYGFTQSVLKDSVQNVGIEYFHMPELGISSEKRRSLISQDDYDELFNNYEKTTLKEEHDSLHTLFRLFKKLKRLAITCFESDHHQCHRSRVANAMCQLPYWKYTLEHI